MDAMLIGDARPQYMLCVDNTDYPASLELHKLYRLLPPQEPSLETGYLRVVDEAGEDYFYSAHRFLRVRLPQTVQAALAGGSV
jgi:hypothetical protein